MHIKKLILFLLMTVTILGNRIEDKLLNKYKGLENYKGKVWTKEEYYKKNGVAYDSKTHEKLTGKAARLFGNGKLRSAASFKDGILHGVQYDYHENGQIYIISNFINGKVEGIEKQYYPSSSLRAEIEYKDGLQNGKVISYHDITPKKIFYEGIYKNGKREGKTLIYNIKGGLEKEKEYKNGLLDGKETKYSENGKIVYVAYYKTGVIQKMITYYTRTNKIEDEFTILSNGNYKWDYYNENGKLDTTGEATIKENEINEEDLRNGRLKSEFEFKRQNQMTSFYPTGKKMMEAELKNGIMNGKMIGYTESQKIRYKLVMRDNKINGALKYYYPTGKIQLECDKIQDKTIYGNCTLYKETGEVEHKGYFDGVSIEQLKKERLMPINSWKEFESLFREAIR